MNPRKLLSNSFFTVMAQGVNSLIQLLCLPVLLKVYGKGDYGLIVIAMSLNTFIAIIQLGVPTGLPKFVAEWLAEGKHSHLHSAMRTVSTFYFAIALVNFILLFALAIWGSNVFGVKHDQVATLQTLLIITALTSCLAIPATALDQLLMGAQEIGFVSRMAMIKNFFFGGLVIFIYFYPDVLNIAQFYAVNCLLMFLLIPAKLMKWTKYGSLSLFIPGWNLPSVLPLLRYCFSLMTFSIFIILADKLRPIIVGVRIPAGAGEALADYQILNNIRLFFMMISGAFVSVLIPHISYSTAGGNRAIYSKTIEDGTKYVWAFGALIGFGIIMLSEEILYIYVGPENSYLKKWLIIFVAGTLYNLYVTPIASVILSSGKLVPMLYATLSGCLISLCFCWMLAPKLGVGAIAISIVLYNLINMLVTHYWYLPRYFNIKPNHQITKIMLPPLVAGVLMYFVGRWLIEFFAFKNSYTNISIGFIGGSIIYSLIILTIYIRPTEVRNLFSKIW